MGPMRIVMVTDSLGAPYGQERVIAQSSALLRAAGHQVRFVAGSLGADVPPNDGVLELKALYQAHWLTARKDIQSFLDRMESFFSFAPPDVIHFIDVPEARVTEWMTDRCPSLVTAHLVSLTCPASHRLIQGGGTCEKKSGWACLVHNHKYQCLSFLKSELHRAHAVRDYLLKRESLGGVPVAAVSEYVKKVLIADGFDPKLVHLVPNPVSVPKVIPASKPEGLVVVASRLVALKGIDRLLKAFAKVKAPSTLWICGDGPERKNLEGLAKELALGTRVTFFGALTHAETLPRLAAADIVAQPNLGPETFGMAVAEASALGRAVLASDVPALNEILERDQTALLTPAGSTDALADNLTKLLDSKSLRERLGAAGKSRMAERFSPESHLAAQLRAYEAALAASKL